MGAISEIEWEACLLEPRPNPALEQRMQRETGRPGQLMRYFEGSPWLADTIVRLSIQHKTHLHIDADLADHIGLVISQDNSCRFCFGMARAFLRVTGVSEARIARMEEDQLTGDFQPRERAILDFSRRLSRGRPLLEPSDVAQLHDIGLSQMEIAEVIGLCLNHLFFNRLATLVALPPFQLEKFPDQWWVRLLRPIIAYKFRRMQHTSAETRLLDEQKSGPGAAIINALDGLPVARDLRSVIDGMWLNAPLSSRTVSLIYAVVAYALGSTHCVAEARARLQEDGLESSDIDQILAHLSSPRLSEIETVLVPFARETVWYKPAQIQRRCAEIQAQIRRDEFLHFVGVVSIVNALCRCAFVAEH